VRPSFNSTGPGIPGEHYVLPPERRLGRVLEHFDDRKYFTLHAGSWFVMFDMRKEPSRAEKLTRHDVEHAGRRIHIVGC